MCTVQAFSAPSTVESNRKSIHFSKSNGKIGSFEQTESIDSYEQMESEYIFHNRNAVLKILMTWILF